MRLRYHLTPKERIKAYKKASKNIRANFGHEFLCAQFMDILETGDMGVAKDMLPEFKTFKPSNEDEFFDGRNIWFDIYPDGANGGTNDIDITEPLCQLERLICLDFCIHMAKDELFGGVNK